MDRRKFLKNSLLAAGVFAGSAIFKQSVFSNTSDTENKKMKILVLTGSPRKNGNSNILADNFIKGATEKGHKVFRFDSAFKNVHPCIGCNKCGMDGPCVFNDDFNFVREHIVDADLVVFVTPMYYFGISAQLKAVIDRFYAINGKIHIPKKAALFMTYANNSSHDEQPIRTHYDVLLDYLGWKDTGRFIVPGVWTAGSINRTDYPKKVYEFGKSL